MRCPDCNKFVGNEPGEVEINSLEVSGSEIQCEARLPINCAECGGELKEGTFNMEEEIDDQLLKDHEGDGHELEVEEDGTDVIDEYQTTDRHGKPIKNSRYQKHLYGVSVNCTLRCSCQESGAEALASFTLEDKMAASSFDQLV